MKRLTLMWKREASAAHIDIEKRMCQSLAEWKGEK